jgi:hypothetical protein
MILGSYSHQVLDISTINPSHASYKTSCSTCHLAGLLVVRSIIIQQAVIISIKFLTRGGKSTAPMGEAQRYKGEMDKTWEVFCGPTHFHTSERTSLIQYMRLKPMNICAIVKTWYMGYGHPSEKLGINTMGIEKPYWWVYDHPLLWENKPCFDQGTYE